jgi:hypothetical protein
MQRLTSGREGVDEERQTFVHPVFDTAVIVPDRHLRMIAERGRMAWQ